MNPRFTLSLALMVFFFSCAKKDSIIRVPSASTTETPVTNSVTVPPTPPPPPPAPIGVDTLNMQGSMLLDQADVPQYTARTWQGIPSIVVDNNNVMYSTWYSGTGGEGIGNYVTVSISKDGGATWLANKLIIAPAAGSNVRFFDSCLWKDNYGTVYLSWTKSNTWWDGKGGVWYSTITLNSSNTIVYSKPRRLTNGVLMNKPYVSSDNNSTLFPISSWVLSPTDAASTGIFVYKAQNNATYKMYTDFGKTMSVPMASSLRIVDEHMIVQLKDKSYFVLIRGTDGLYFAKSGDGVNWDAVKKFTAVGNTTSSRFFLGRLKSGKLALVLNNSTGRRDMKLYLSNDDGDTWSSGFLIDSRLGVSYPDLAQDANGKIYLTYDFDRYNVGNIILASFTESDVINNRTANITTTIISKLK